MPATDSTRDRYPASMSVRQLVGYPKTPFHNWLSSCPCFLSSTESVSGRGAILCPATLRFDVTAQVRQRTAQADMIINQQIVFSLLYTSGESWRCR